MQVSQAAQLRFALVRLVVITAGTAALIAFAFPLISGNAAYPVVLLAVSAMAANCTASLQCSVIGIASKWGSREMLAVMSGQGGIAVLISAAQLLLALVGTVSKKRKHAGEMAVTTADIVTGACLWLLAAAASVGCLLSSGAVSQPPITAVAAAVEEQEELLDADAEVAKPALESGNLQILRRNWIVNASVFVVFLVTLVSTTATRRPASSPLTYRLAVHLSGPHSHHLAGWFEHTQAAPSGCLRTTALSALQWRVQSHQSAKTVLTS